jgi:hypothetical protein
MPSISSCARLLDQSPFAVHTRGVVIVITGPISDDSRKLEPLLPLATELYVLAGPVSASGYAWYEGASLTSRHLPSGWGRERRPGRRGMDQGG